MSWSIYTIKLEPNVEDYTYTSLDLTKNEIRLISLNPSSDPESQIHGDLHQSKVGEKVDINGRMLGYQALSYV
jgi:hypothetical protein